LFADEKKAGGRQKKADERQKGKKSRKNELPFLVFSTLEDGVAEGGRRLPEADIASPFRRKGCARRRALAASGQGKPA
jgi:hypothetical protein